MLEKYSEESQGEEVNGLCLLAARGWAEKFAAQGANPQAKSESRTFLLA